MLFAASAFMSLVAFILCFIIKLPKQELSDYQRRSKWHLKLSTLVDPAGLRIGSIMLVVGTAYAAALVFLAGYAEDNGVASAASLFFVAFAAASLVARLFVARLQDVLGDNFVIYPVFIFNLIGNILLAMWPTMTGIILAGVFVGLGFGSLMPCMQAIAVKSVPMSRVAVATSSFFLLLTRSASVQIHPRRHHAFDRRQRHVHALRRTRRPRYDRLHIRPSSAPRGPPGPRISALRVVPRRRVGTLPGGRRFLRACDRDSLNQPLTPPDRKDWP